MQSNEGERYKIKNLKWWAIDPSEEMSLITLKSFIVASSCLLMLIKWKWFRIDVIFAFLYKFSSKSNDLSSKVKSSAEFSGFLLKFHSLFVLFKSFEFIGFLSYVEVFFSSDGQTEHETNIVFVFGVENKSFSFIILYLLAQCNFLILFSEHIRCCNCGTHNFCNINRAYD